jgi:hypothetical protein
MLRTKKTSVHPVSFVYNASIIDTEDTDVLRARGEITDIVPGTSPATDQ